MSLSIGLARTDRNRTMVAISNGWYYHYVLIDLEECQVLKAEELASQVGMPLVVVMRSRGRHRIPTGTRQKKLGGQIVQKCLLFAQIVHACVALVALVFGVCWC